VHDALILFRAELLKLRTVRGPWLCLAAGPLLVIAGISGLVVSGGNLRDPGQQAQALAHVGLASLFSLAFGILAVAGEYRHKTITDAFLSTPARGRVIAAKLAVYTILGGLAAVVAALAGLLVAAAWWSGQGVPFAWGEQAMWVTIGGGIGWNAAFAALGVGLGALVRNPVAAIAAALAWIALVEGIAGQLAGAGAARWLPLAASEALDRASLTASAARLLPQWAGGVVLLGYAGAFAAAALITTLRRDVT
jgi:ABC-2 type transport system permease protein